MLIGAATPSDAAANTAGSLALMASLLFGGFMLNKDQVGVAIVIIIMIIKIRDHSRHYDCTASFT